MLVEQLKMKQKNKKAENLLTDKWAKAKIPGPGAIRADEEVTRVDQDF